MKKLRVAVIGQGRSGLNIHGKFFLSEANDLVEVRAVVDEIEFRREKAKNLFGCDVYSDYTALFERDDIDLVVNATFSHLHYPITRDLLLHGFHVLSEKPFARTWVQTQDLIRIARENNRILAVFHQSLLAPNYRKFKEVVQSGVLGTIHQVDLRYSGFARRWDWQTMQFCCAGSLYNTGPHPIGMALDLLEWDPNTQVSFARLDTVLTSGDGDDYAKILLTAPGRHVTDIEITSADAVPGYTFKACGSRGSIVVTGQHYKVRYVDWEGCEERPLIREPLANADGVPVYCSEKLDWIEEEADVAGSAFDTAVRDFYQMMHDCILDGKPLTITPYMAAEVIRIIETCHSLNRLPVRYGQDY